MNYTLEQIKPFFSGCIRFEEQDGYLYPRRMTPYIEQKVEKHNLMPRQYSTAGVKLDFYACAGSFSFDYKITRGSGGKLYGIDVTADGIEIFHVYQKFEEEELFGSVQVEIPAGEKDCRVTVFFPNTAICGIQNVQAPEGIRKAERTLRILMNGDSITHGMFAQHPRLTYANIVGEKLNAEVLNHGIGGDKYWAENLDENLDFKPDVILVSYGTNDWTAAFPDLAERIDAYYKRLRELYPATPVLTIPPVWRGNSDGVLYAGLLLQDVRGIIRQTAERYGCFVADEKRVIPAHPDYFSPDKLHPNDLGFMIYGEAVTEYIKELL